MLTYDELVIRIATWAESEEDVRGVMMLGSRARTDHPADEWADLDVVIFARNSDQYIHGGDWTGKIAPRWLTFIERTGDGRAWERRCMYEGGLDVDFALNPEEWLDGMLHQMPRDAEDILRKGVRVLVDKDGKLAKIVTLPFGKTAPFERPAEHEFLNVAKDFWYHTVWSAKHLRRGELWWAKTGVDMHLKGLLQRMLEWHAQAMRGSARGVWLRGRFLEEWADPRAVEQLCQAFAHYDAQDVARALLVTMDIFRRLEDETAAQWHYLPEILGEHHTAAYARQLLDPLLQEVEH